MATSIYNVKFRVIVSSFLAIFLQIADVLKNLQELIKITCAEVQ